MGKIKKEIIVKSRSPDKVHDQIMQGSLGKAIMLKKFEDKGIMTPRLQHSFSQADKQKKVFRENTCKDEHEQSKLDLSKEVVNLKSNKNLHFLPFMKERNGVGRIIDSVNHLAIIQDNIGLRSATEAQTSAKFDGDQQNIEEGKKVERGCWHWSKE